MIVAMPPRLLPLFLLAGVAPLASAQTSAPATVDLFAAADFSGWTAVTPAGADIAAICTRADRTIQISGTPTGYLLTEASYANYKLHLEYRWPTDAAPKSNSGVLLNIGPDPAENNSPWPTCIQLQTKARYAGDLLQMSGATFAESVTTPARGRVPPIRARQSAVSELPFGEWNSVDIVSLDGALEIRINGVLQNSVTQVSPASGRIGIQLEGSPFELRNVELTPLPQG